LRLCAEFLFLVTFAPEPEPMQSLPATQFVTYHWTRRGCIALALLLLVFGSLAVGCKPKSDRPPTAAQGNPKQEQEKSVYRQAIDQAKGLEKQINDRAIDPGEKARLGGPDPTGQDQ
jgi:hypothetical protein